MFSSNKTKKSDGNQSFVENRKKEEQNKLDSQKSECWSLIVAMSKYIRNPLSYNSDLQRFEYSGGFECDFKKLFQEFSDYENIVVKEDAGVLAPDNKWERKTGARPYYYVKRTVVEEKVEYEIQ